MPIFDSAIFDPSVFDTGSGGGGPGPLTFGGYVYNDSFNAISTTFTGLAIGPAASDRWVIAALAIAHDGSQSLSAVTIGGVSATRMYFNAPGSPGTTFEFWKANVPTGTTANVFVTDPSGIIYEGGCATYYCTGEPTFHAGQGDRTYTGLTFSVSIDVPEGGAVLAAVLNDSAGVLSGWVGVTADATDNTHVTYFASEDQLAAETGRTVSFTTTASTPNPTFSGLGVLSVSVPAGGGGGSPQTIAPPLVDEGDTFFAATVAPGAVVLAPPSLADADTFFAASVFAGTVALAPPLVDEGDVFFPATVVQAGAGAQTLSPPLLDEGDTIFGATVTRGVVVLGPPQVVDADTFYPATITRGPVGITPPLISDPDAFFAPTVVRGVVTVTPPVVVDIDTFFAATVVRGAVTLSPAFLDGGDTFFPAALLPGAVFLSPPLVDEGDVFYAAVVTAYIAAPINPERIFLMPPELRTLAMPAMSDRIAIAFQEHRSAATPAETRTYVVEALNRVVYASEDTGP